jgi:hypothetical protein
MITLKDIFKAVCEHITTNTNIPLADADMEEPVIRPSFKIFMNTAKSGLYSSALRQVRVYFNIYFYASDRKHSKSEIFEIEDKLAFSFLEPFFIKETCCVYVDDVDFEKVTDGIFNCSFDFEIGTEFIDESDFENMEELYIEEEI